MLRVQNLSKRYGKDGDLAVRDISFAVPTGAFFTLLGPSGCGKTTTLRCVAGLERPDEGKITLNDEVIFSARKRVNRPPNRRNIGMVFQSYAIWPHMTVAENLRYPLDALQNGLSRAEVTQRQRSMLARMGLDGLDDRWATQLSGGQQQRLALGRALIASPGLLLLDEPLSNLDAKLRTSMRAELRKTQRDLGVTTLYVTHDQAEALSISDIVAVVRNGAIEQVGTPREIYNTPVTEFVADFIGQANLIRGRREHEHAVETPIGRVVTKRPVEGAHTTVCVRPESVRIIRPATEASPDENVYRAKATDVEFLGNSLACAVDVAGLEIRLIAPPSYELRAGDDVDIHIPPEECHPIVAGSLDATLTAAPFESSTSTATASHKTTQE